MIAAADRPLKLGTLEQRQGRGPLVDKLHSGERTAMPYEAAGKARSKLVER
jgi:hypothetical protein